MLFQRWHFQIQIALTDTSRVQHIWKLGRHVLMEASLLHNSIYACISCNKKRMRCWMPTVLTGRLLSVPRSVSNWPLNTDLTVPSLTLETSKKPQVLMSLKCHSHTKFSVNSMLSRLRRDSFETRLKICCCADGVVTGRVAECSLILQLLGTPG